MTGGVSRGAAGRAGDGPAGGKALRADLRLARALVRGSDRREWWRLLLTATGAALLALLALAALAVAGLAFVPAVGYLEAVVLPALGLRLRRREPERHAGLRTLARD
jgi:hypothetical protein